MNAKTARIIEHSRPTLNRADEEAVREAVASGILVGGARLDRFETEIARAAGRRHAVALTSGSTSIHLSLLALDLEEGSEVAIPSYGCISLLQAVSRAGYRPLPVDCDPATFAIDPADLLRRRTHRTSVVLQVHTFGYPCRSVGEPFEGLKVIDDIATAIGAGVDDRPCGSAGDLAVCSFHATKMITTGTGGAVAGDDPRLVDRILDLVSYDAREDAAVRFNERMGEVQAALGITQIERLEEMISRRRVLAEIYRESLAGSPAILPTLDPEAEPSWHRYVIRIPGGSEPVRRHLESRGVRSPKPVHRPIHEILELQDYPGTEVAQREALSLPIYPTLSDENARFIAEEVLACLAAT